MEEGTVFDSDWAPVMADIAHPFDQFFAENPAILIPTVQHDTARKRSYSEPSSYTGGSETTKDTDTSAEERQLRRKLVNRESARRARQRKQEFVAELQQKITEMHIKNEDLKVKYEASARNYEQVLAENTTFKAQIKDMHGAYEDLKVKYEASAQNYEQVLAENMTIKAQIKDMHVAYEDLKVKYEAFARNYEQVLAENMTFKAQEKRNKDGEKMSAPMPTNLNHIQKSACGKQSYLELLQNDDLDPFELGTIFDW
ncbi:uncharacterized protein [Elaeis guineensis]|uniref:Transcription factor RF2b-like n=1 Tax=Elaeis guineensis var. tenera TaxID=51953 RepID=A0A8N4F6F4_ELAGV|nr:transcription factor RF2b-like [Elaeis guineensis]